MPNLIHDLDGVFQALGHPTRRAVVHRLGHGPEAVSRLAEPFDMALPSFLQHLHVLEGRGLVVGRKEGRVRTYRLTPGPLRAAEGWLGEQRLLWEKRLDQLDDYLIQLKQERGEP